MNNSNYNLVYNTLNKNNLARNEIGARTNNYVDNLVNIISIDNIVTSDQLIFGENNIINCTESRINNNLGNSRILWFSNTTLQTTNSLLTYARLQRDKSYILSVLNYYQNTEIQIYKKINDTQFELMKTLSNSYNFFYPGKTLDVLLVIKNIAPLNKNPLTPYVGLFIAETPYAIDNYGQITGINNIPLDIWNEPTEIEAIKDDNELVSLLNAEQVTMIFNGSQITIAPPKNEKIQNYFTTQWNKRGQISETETVDLLVLIPWRDNLVTETRRTAHCLKKNHIASYKTYQARYTCLYGAKDYAQSAHVKMVLPIFQGMQNITLDLNNKSSIDKRDIDYYPQFGNRISKQDQDLTRKRGHFHKKININGKVFTGRTTLFTCNPYWVARLMNGGSKLLYYKAGTDISIPPTFCNKTENISITDELTQKQYKLKKLPYNCICFSWGILRVTGKTLKSRTDWKDWDNPKILTYWGFRRGNWKNANIFYPENFQGSMSKNIIVPVNLKEANQYSLMEVRYQPIQTVAQDIEGYMYK